MKCPHCETLLKMTERQGIEIDYCPGCRGVWLDRGELDKIIERSSEQFAGQREAPQTRQPYTEPRYQAPRSQKSGYQGHQKPYGHYKKRKSFLGEIFDIFD